ncbi:hypothetical protein bmyco0003_21560 [Bacillus pseudomycoides]|nr:hypothetical protein bmyco0003_21560 [Bacillus pseudomycoides]
MKNQTIYLKNELNKWFGLHSKVIFFYGNIGTIKVTMNKKGVYYVSYR